jgi:L-arabinose isomerase
VILPHLPRKRQYVLEEWCRAANVVRTLRGSRFLGHTYPGMLDLYSDSTMHHAQLGLHVEILEMDDLRDKVDSVSDDAVAAKVEETRNTLELDESVIQESLD